MRGRVLSCIGAIGLASATPPALAQDGEVAEKSIEISSDSLALAERIVDLGFPVEIREALFFAAIDQIQGQMREAVLGNMPSTDEGTIAVVDEWIADYNEQGKDVLRGHIPVLMSALAKSYAVMFTHEELEDILAFVSTPSGQRFFELSGAVMAEPHFAEANQAYMN